MIHEKSIEQAELEFQLELHIGKDVARNNNMTLTKFKSEILIGLTSKNDEDQWTFDYESYLTSIARGGFQSPIEWGKHYYFDRWSL